MAASSAVARLPLAPLVAASSRDSQRNLAQLLRVDPRQITRWIDGIPIYTADRLACQLGLHPAEVWGRAWWEAA